jgi:predicted metal-dependent hydrolase
LQLGLFQTPDRLVEQRVTLLGQQRVSYVLKRSAKRRRMLLSVDEGGLTVSVPFRTSERRIAELLQHSETWLLGKLQEYAARRRPARVWEEGALLDFVGQQLRLKLARSAGRPVAQLQDGGTLLLALPQPDCPEQVRELVIHWYRRHAGPHLRARAEHFAAQISEPVPRVLLSSAVGRWGSCNAKREVRLSWRLMQAPPHVIDYVVAHEVAHLRVMSHSQRFWRLVEKLHPGYASARAELDSMGHYYMSL